VNDCSENNQFLYDGKCLKWMSKWKIFIWEF
jgi:hypothetical protein